MKQIPNNWSEVTVAKFIEIKKIPLDASVLEIYIELVSIFTDIDDEVINKMDILEFIKYGSKFTWLNETLTTKFNKQINDLKFIECMSLSLGEFIDLDYYVANNMYDNLPNICSVFYKKENGSKEEPDFYLLLSITEVFGVLTEYLNFKLMLEENYKHILTQQYDEEEDLSMFDEEELKEIQKEIENEKRAKKWAWETLLYNLTNGDVTKYDSILDKPIIFIFNHLSFLKDNKLPYLNNPYLE